MSPQLRLAWTVDDLVFSGVSLWTTTRSSQGQLLSAERCPIDEWRVDEDSRILVQERPVSEDEVILFVGFHEGVLNFGSDTLRTAKLLEQAVAQRVKVPLPVVELHQTTDDVLEDDEIAGLIAAYVKARQDVNGAVVFTPSEIELKSHAGDSVTGDAAIQARNASAIDVARLLGIPGSLIDASNVNASLTYETTSGRGLEFAQYSLALYTGAIESRLSMDDVVPRGQRVRFDMSAATGPIQPTGSVVDD